MVCKLFVTFINTALKLNIESLTIKTPPCFSLPARYPNDFLATLLVCLNVDQFFKQEMTNCSTSEKMWMTRIPCFYSLIWLRDFFLSSKKIWDKHERECNQNLKAIQAEMISEQKSFRKVLKRIISVLEHKALWLLFFLKKVLREEKKGPFWLYLHFVNQPWEKTNGPMIMVLLR